MNGKPVNVAMKRALARLRLLIPALLLLAGCSWSIPKSGGSGTAEPPPAVPQAPAPPADPIHERLKTMTADQKIGQLLMAGIEGTQLDEETRAMVRNDGVGGFIFYKNNIQSTAQALQLLGSLKQAAGGSAEPLWLGVDEEGGRVTRMPDELIKLPSAQNVGKADSPDASYGIGRAIGTELAALGLNVDFAPVLDVNSNPNNPVIGDRSFGAAAAVVGRNGTAELQGIASQGVLPVVKHFPGHGDTSVDSHIGLPVVSHGLDRLRSLELKPFAEALRNGAEAVMVAHILLPKLDPEYPASFSKPVITGLLRKELGFDGVVITDDLTMGAVVKNYDIGQAAVRSLEAGSDVLLVGHGYELEKRVLQAVREAVRTGRLTTDRLDESVYRILKLKAKYKLTNEPKGKIDTARINGELRQALEKLRSSK